MDNSTTALIEETFDQLSQAIDSIPEPQERLFLAKLAFLACKEIRQPSRVHELIDIARRDIDRED